MKKYSIILVRSKKQHVADIEAYNVEDLLIKVETLFSRQIGWGVAKVDKVVGLDTYIVVNSVVAMIKPINVIAKEIV